MMVSFPELLDYIHHTINGIYELHLEIGMPEHDEAEPDCLLCDIYWDGVRLLRAAGYDPEGK